MPAEETDLMTQFIASKLEADSALATEVSTHIYDTVAPPDVDPAKKVIFSFQAGSDVMINSAIRACIEAVFVVKMVGEDKEFSELLAGALRIDQVLHRTSGNVTGGRVLSCYRERAIRFIENDSGVIRRHLGGLYRITAQAT